jgi:hypothetical protein
MTDSAAQAPAVDRVRFVEHKGKRVLFHDLSNISDPRDAFPAVAQSKAIVAQQPPKSLLTLTYVQGSRFNREIIDALKDLVVHNGPYVRHGVIVGLAGLQKVVYVTLTQLTGRRLPTFATVDEGLDWLVAQD